MGEDQPPKKDIEQPPPFFSSWYKMYAFVLGTLIVLIILFYLITIHYS
jgi:hypothetical protein